MIHSPRDVRRLAAAVSELGPATPARDLARIVHLFLSVDKSLTDAIRREAIPELVRLHDRLLEGGAPGRTILFVVRVLAAYRDEAGTERVADAVGRYPEDLMWSMIFAAFRDDHPHVGKLLAALARCPPAGYAEAGYLELLNHLCATRKLAAHPFASGAGVARLRALVLDEDATCAGAATGALGWLGEPARSELLGRAAAHPSLPIRIAAATELSRLGREEGVKRLIDWCADPRTAAGAVRTLDGLGHGARVPAEARTEEHAAMSAMCEWLAFPTELGAPPDEIELADSRVLYWPPTRDRRRMYVFRYSAAEEEGFGLVGSVTFALFGEATGSLEPLDVYALHCCWELERRGDPRAPAKRSISAGRELLRRENPGLG